MRYRVPLRADKLFLGFDNDMLRTPVSPLETPASVASAVHGKHVWILGGSTYVREQLSSVLFGYLKGFVQSLTDTHLTFMPHDEEELRSLLARVAGEAGKHVILLAEDAYGEAFDQLCERLPMASLLLPVLTPTGILLPALSGGKWSHGALFLKNNAARKLLSGKKVAVWGKERDCLDRLFYLLAAVAPSVSIAGVVHKTIRSLAVGDCILQTIRPEAAGTLQCDLLLATQEALEDNKNAFAATPLHMPVVMLRDKTAVSSAVLVFYASPSPVDLAPVKKHLPDILRNGYCAKSSGGEYENGFRKTAWQPKVFDNSIHVLGPSHTEGVYVSLEETYCSQLQYLLNQHHEKDDAIYTVRNLGVGGAQNWSFLLCLLDSNVTHGDIVVLHNRRYDICDMQNITAMHKFCMNKGAQFFVFDHSNISMLENLHKDDIIHADGYCYRNSIMCFDTTVNSYKKNLFISELKEKGIRVFDLREKLEKTNKGIFYDSWHLNATGHKLIAEYIYEKINTPQPYDIADATRNCILESLDAIRKATLRQRENKRWLDAVPRIRESANEILGSIVMNCNPFTLGHKHIIRQALEKVDKLYIFVVQEDKSFFSFEERYAMVRDGVEEFGKRVCVMPSGQMIISSTTFPDYFCKDSVTYEPDTKTDILIFCSTVAPALGIQVRLFGEEPYCKVTAAYHKQLSELLPICGILPIQLPRLEQAGVAISASGVRRILKKRKFSQLARLVPPTSMPYLIKKTLPAEDTPLRLAG